MKRLFAAMTAALLMAALAPAAASGHGFLPITATGYADNVADTGTCNNYWATDDLLKAYKLTLIKAGVYNLEVKEHGPFTTIAGVSPGACEKIATSPGNGNTVAAGVTGTEHQEWNATVTSTTTPNLHPSCAGVNGCVGSGDFLNAVFGTSNWTRGDWSFTGLYMTRANGTWFDTSVNWPYKDRGDITGSSGRYHRS